ncbi:ATP-binding protein [Candidatus Gracilibacteria bacterium]|nr:ATP-binding protein [Candidatus Gracilibacteria bacterium]
MYKRTLENSIKSKLFKGKVVIIYGPRQVGKTTLSKKIMNESGVKTLYIQADIESQRDLISKPEPKQLKSVFGDAKLVVIDEAQNITNIGTVLKTFVDTYPNIQIIATGSSSFELSNKIKEPLTGRVYEFFLYPLSVEEISNDSLVEFKGREDFLMRYGFYPGIINSGIDEARINLETIKESYLYKDVFILEDIKKPEVLRKLVTLLAFSIGSSVSVNSLAVEIGTTAKTIERYLDLLEKMFVIKRLYGFSRNLSNEIKKGFKAYFVDIGIRNSIIKNHNDIEHRDDIGGLFENLFVIERIKYHNNHEIFANRYFWRNYNSLEVDYLEERDGKLFAFECKYKERPSKGLKVFEEEYKNSEIVIVHKDNLFGSIKK